MRLYRLGTAAFPIWDARGAAAHGGRWNPQGMPVIYAAGSLSLAMLERLVQRRNLADTLVIEAKIPEDLKVDDLMAARPANWQALGSPEAVAAGGKWLASLSAVLLRVPSALVPREANYLINPAHPEFARIGVGAPEPLEWNARRFGVPSPE